MRFEQLERSIRLNAGEKPSLYLAMCMIRSLFRDITAAAGTNLLSAVPQGDERLPIELTFIEGQLLEIYEENKEGFQRGTERLARKTQQLREQEAQLAAFGDVSGRLKEAERLEAELSDQLSEALARKKRADELAAECQALREKLSAIGNIDPKQGEEALGKLEAQLTALEAERGSLTKRINEGQQRIAELSEKNRKLRESEEALQENLRAISGFCTEAETSIRKLVEEKKARDERKTELEDRLKAVQDELGTVVQEISELNSRISEFEASTLTPERDRLNSAREQQASLEQEAETLRKQFQLAVTKVGKLNEELPQKRQKLKEKTEELQQNEKWIAETDAQIQETEEKLSVKFEELAKSQAEYTRLNSEELPETERLLQTQKDRNQMLRDQIGTRTEELEALKKSIAEEEAALSELNDRWKEKDTAYQTLVAQTRARDESITQLQKHVEELKGKNDEDKALQLKQQLQAEERALQAAEAERVRLQAQLSTTEAALEEAKKNLKQLAEEKQNYETNREALRKKIDELSPYTSGDYIEKSRKLEEQIAFLRNSESSLKETMQVIARIVPWEEQSGWNKPIMSLTQLEDELDHLKKYIGRLRENLSACANSISEGLKRRPQS